LRTLQAARRFLERAGAATTTVPVEVVTDRAPRYPVVLDGLLAAAWHRTDRYANNQIEADHGRLKARLRPMRGFKQDPSARVVIAGHAFVQNLRRGHDELAVEAPTNPRMAVAFDELALAIRHQTRFATPPCRSSRRNRAPAGPRRRPKKRTCTDPVTRKCTAQARSDWCRTIPPAGRCSSAAAPARWSSAYSGMPWKNDSRVSRARSMASSASDWVPMDGLAERIDRGIGPVARPRVPELVGRWTPV
jgi:DDE domain